MANELQHFIGGQPVAGRSGRFGDVFNPATGEVAARCPYASADEVDAAVQVATAAGRDWAKHSIAARLEVIFNFRNEFIAARDDLAGLVSLEHGKTRGDSQAELQRSLESIEYACSMPELTKGEYSLNIGGSIDNFSVLQPSERVPSAALALAGLWQRAGLPDGVWNVGNGDREAVEAMLRHPGIAAISFVGSTKVAASVYEEGCRHHKRVMAFGGGKNHMVVMPDADLDLVADHFVGAGFGSAAQRCMAVSLAVPVGAQTADALVERLIPRIEKLRVGAYSDPQADFGPLITRQAQQSVMAAVEEGIAAGARVHVDGRGLKVPGGENGFFVGGTLLDDVRPGMRFYEEEVFGPARGIVRAGDVTEAIRLVNEHELGNGVAIFTRDGFTARRFLEEVDVGMIGINVPVPVPAGYHNFGGLKRSKFGEGHLFGPDAVRFYTKVKTVSARWPEPKQVLGGAQFTMPTNE